MADATIQTKHREMLNHSACSLDTVLNGEVRPQTLGFALFVFELGRTEGGRVSYISNADRLEMLVAIRDWLACAEGRVADGGSKQ